MQGFDLSALRIAETPRSDTEDSWISESNRDHKIGLQVARTPRSDTEDSWMFEA